MAIEGQDLEKKSLQVLEQRRFHDLAQTCVAFANAIGGRLLIGLEDDADLPPPSQKVKDSWVSEINRRIPQLTNNVALAPTKKTAANGGEYLEVKVFRAPTIAGTSDGRYFLRVADETRVVMPDELFRLMGDKAAYVWETQISQRLPRQHFEEEKRHGFLELIRRSERVSMFVKEKSDDEILDYYLFTTGECLTNLGVLWIGRRVDRATLPGAPVVQFIKYDETERKVNKLVWDDFSLNPLELIEAVWQQVPDWRESYELPDGIFRRNVPHYDERVIRELLANALVHRPYTQRGDIFINLYPDRLEIHNPGRLPLGVTPRNILHKTVKRNEQLAKVFYDLKLMEREGSGYDMMYEVLLANGKPLPEVREGDDRVTVTVQKRIADVLVVDFLFKADQTFPLKQKDRIALGLIAQHEALTAQEMVKCLDLQNAGELKSWLGRLLKWRIIKKRGRTRGVEYYVEPGLLRKLDFKGRTTLKGIESYRLRALVLEDLARHREAGISEIHERVGNEIPRHKLKRALRELVKGGELRLQGANRWARYSYHMT